MVERAGTTGEKEVIIILEIPEEKKVVLRDGLHNTAGELNLISMRLGEIETHVLNLYQYVDKQPASAELEKHLDSMKSTIEAARNNKAEADKHLDKVRNAVRAITGVIG